MAEKEYTHCLICRRKLKNPKFRKLGTGDKCFKKYQRKTKAKATQIEMNI